MEFPQGHPISSGIPERDVAETDPVTQARRSGKGLGGVDDARLEIEEFEQVREKQPVRVDLTDVRQQCPHQALAPLERLVEERDVAQRRTAQERPCDHPCDRAGRDQEGNPFCTQPREALIFQQVQALGTQASSQRAVGIPKVVGQAEEPDLARVPGLREDDAEVLGATPVRGRALPPIVVATAGADNHEKRRKGTEQQRWGEPDAVREQHGRHGHQGDAVLHQPTAAFEQRQRTIAGIAASPVEVVVKVGGFIEGEVDGGGLGVHEIGDVVLDQLRLGSPDPLEADLEQLGE